MGNGTLSHRMLHGRFIRNRRFDSGAALVIVLGLLVIILGLAVTFLARAAVERSASAGYASAATTRTLSDSAVNLVQAQIRHATTQGETVAWTSQPGMIRTFGDDVGGSSLRAYKLYSADKLILDEPTANELAADLPPASWANDKAIWSDLNSPVSVNGNQNYPILDPRALGEVEGFSITDAPTLGTTNLAPMPVRWLYVLQSGVIASPQGGGNGVTIPGASKEDPIVGRIAFWTDDDTAKVNINTASEGTFWDTPRVNSAEDRKYAESQPAQKEFQRYPGHPATTSLAPIFFAKDGVTLDELTKQQRDAIYKLTPRIAGGGSDGGSVVYTSTAPIPLDGDRLYASVDEMIFNADRGTQESSLALDKGKLERAKFFLSSNSRAPEVTLFNTPRVAAWPIDKVDDDANRSPFDRLIAFCSTINGNPYYFTREDPLSATKDFSNSSRNQQLYTYLQGLSSRSVPGFGGNFLEKYPNTPNGSDRDQILTEMFDYIRITNLNDPLVTNNFYKRGKYGDGLMGNGQVTPIRIGQTQGFGRIPMVTEVGIQFICTADPGTNPATEPNGLAGSNVVSNVTLASDNGVPVLLAVGERRVEAMLLFETFVPSVGWPPIFPAITIRVKGLDTIKVENAATAPVYPFPSSRFPSQGVVGSGRNTAAGNIYGGMSYGGSVSPRWMYAQALSPARLGGKIPKDVWTASMPNIFNDPYPTYPFISDPFTVKSSVPPSTTPLTMTVSSGTITVEVFSGQGDTVSGSPVYTTEMKLDPTTMPIPILVHADLTLKGTDQIAVTVPKESFWTFSAGGALGNGRLGRLARSASTAGQPGNLGMAIPFVPGRDVLRTLVPRHSDFRLLGGENSTATTDFIGIKPEVAGDFLAHSMGEGGRNGVFYGYVASTVANSLAKSVTYTVWNSPDVAYASSASHMGDWDNGVALGTDGPFINKADEGNKSKLSLGNLPYYKDEEVYETTGTGQFSPNRQMPSAGMFGSLPTGMKSGKPYQTLLFRPQPSHPQSTQSRPGQPADYLWTDLFWMPVVEPYAISEPFSTAGKINMNYEIKPFSYIKRATGLYALMRSERLLAIPATSVNNYKYGANAILTNTRLPIDIKQTLFQFESKFNNDGDVFRSASQICDIYLIPRGQTWLTSSSYSQANLDASAATYWNANRLTGDNSRERPYTNLLGRLTTKSNTYTVHYRVQALKQSPASAQGIWDESKDRVLGEYRGSTTIERYISPKDAIPDYAAASDPTSLPDLGGFYKWRVLSAKQFAP